MDQQHNVKEKDPLKYVDRVKVQRLAQALIQIRSSKCSVSKMEHHNVKGRDPLKQDENNL